MKISSVDRPQQMQNTSRIKVNPISHDFSDSLNMAKKEQDKKLLMEKLKKINRIGEELKDQPNSQKITEYKKEIKEFLSFILKRYYKISYSQSMYSKQLLIRVEVVNKKIEELTIDFLHRQKDTFNIIKKIDDISGLLIDLIL
jgi:uncharacterized protein YaaR (DUF327 family)